MSQQHLLHEEDLSAILISPSPVLVIKRVFRLTLRAAQGFIDSIFTDECSVALPGLHQCQQAQSRLMSVSKRSPGVKSRIW
jgi:hypothetical protein